MKEIFSSGIYMDGGGTGLEKILETLLKIEEHRDYYINDKVNE